MSVMWNRKALLIVGISALLAATAWAQSSAPRTQSTAVPGLSRLRHIIVLAQENRSFDQYFGKFLNYAEWGAAQAFRDGRRAGLIEIGFRPTWRFFRMYVLQAGFLDGLHGLVLCALQAFGVFLKYARLWEYGIRSRRGEQVRLPAFDDSISTWKRPEPS